MWLRRYSHIYLEEGAEDFELAQTVLRKLGKATVVRIRNYKDIFARPGQNFQLQKQSPKLILARKKANFIYKGSMASQDFGYKNFYYNTLQLNCVYNCDYCYLQGMYPSGNSVVFINDCDFFEHTRQAIKSRPFPKEPLYLCISYDTDLLAMESFIPYTSRFVEFTRSEKDLVIEVRTKSANWSSMANVEPNHRCILAWTLSPPSVAAKYEKLTPPPEKRIVTINRYLERGWPIRLCFDPVLQVENWEQIYGDFMRFVFAKIPASQICDVSLGVFRMNSDYFKRIKKQRTDSDLFYRPYEKQNSFVSYPEGQRQQMMETLKLVLQEFLPPEKVEVWL
tara:strand:+ start:1371 stop:2381 length:1011 start_codon:yes stop_codon:yes gene_type:complete